MTSTQRTQTFTKRIGFKIKHENKGSGRLIFALVETKSFLPSGKSRHPPFFLGPQIFKQADVLGND